MTKGKFIFRKMIFMSEKNEELNNTIMTALHSYATHRDITPEQWLEANDKLRNEFKVEYKRKKDRIMTWRD